VKFKVRLRRNQKSSAHKACDPMQQAAIPDYSNPSA